MKATLETVMNILINKALNRIGLLLIIAGVYLLIGCTTLSGKETSLSHHAGSNPELQTKSTYAVEDPEKPVGEYFRENYCY